MQNIPDYSDIIRLIQTPEGRKLIAMLQSADSNAMNRAISSARSGDYEAAKNTLAGFLDTPEAQALLKTLGGSHG